MISSKKMSDVLLKLYDFEPGMSFRSHLFQVFDAFIPATISSFAVTNLESGQMEVQEIRHLRAGKVLPLDTVNRIMKHHPFLEYFQENSAGAVLTISDLLSDSEWTRSVVYEQLHRPLGTMHEASIRFYQGSKCMSVHFADLEPLDMDSRRLLTLVAPHLSRAFKICNKQQQSSLEKIPDHIVTLNTAGHVLDFPRQSRVLFDHYFPKPSNGPDCGLPAPVEQWLRSMAGAAAGVRRKAFSRRGMNTLEVSLHCGENCMLLILEEKRVVRMMEVLLDYGLTQRQAEVMIWVTQGKQNGEIATILGIRQATVRKHVEHILQRLHCETRGAAAQLVMNTISMDLPHAQCRICTKAKCEDCAA